MIKKKILHIVLCCVATIFIAGGCSPIQWDDEFYPDSGITNGNSGNREENEDRRKVLLLYSAGYNSLRSYLLEDIEDLKSGWLPTCYQNHDVVLVYTHTTEKKGAYNTPTSPYLLRLYTNDNGEPVADTLITYEAGTRSSTAEQFNKVLTYVKEKFPAGNYGMIFSSHATGYLPSGFYNKPQDYVFPGINTMMKQKGSGFQSSPVPYYEPEFDPSLPMVKSVGQDQVGTTGEYVSYEMEIRDFAEAIPMKFDYILFDACLMGGIEVAYELRSKCDLVGFSQTEVLAEGLNYKTITEHLLKNQNANPQAVCEDFFSQYIQQEGVYQSATISLIDCNRLEPLAEICKELFEKYRVELYSVNHKNVQQYFRSSYRYFYDLKSIILKIGATPEEVKKLDDALAQCVVYGAHTPKFMEEFWILTYSGFSMYLPRDMHTAFYYEELNAYYKTLQWNKATGLVK